MQVGASPRGSLALLKLSRCRAALDGRDYVTPDDVKSVAVPALAHRLTLRPELWVQRVSAEDVVRERLETVPTPAAEDLATRAVTRYATPKLAAYAGSRRSACWPRWCSARPELVALTAPFLLALVRRARARDAAATHGRRRRSTSERALEGDEIVPRTDRARGAGAVDRLELYVRLPDGIELAEGRNPVGAAPRAPGERRELELTLRAARWGGAPDRADVPPRARPARLCSRWEATRRDAPGAADLPPRGGAAADRSQPRETQVFTGNEVARRKGEGIEFADIRLWAPGDPLKRVNWRASARRGELWVNESHPERNTDVILFVDSFAEARRGDEGTLDLAVRATAALADAYVRRRDRVGLISFGGILRWLVPGTGIVQLYRIVDALLDTQIFLSYYWKEIDVIPRRTLPPSALVIALSPLLDPRSVGALLDLRARGFDLAVIDVSPVPFTARPSRGLDAVAYDVWTLAPRRAPAPAAARRRRRGRVATTSAPLQAVLEEVRAFRRYARHARA